MKVFKGRGSFLEIRGVSREDEGEYRCEASNKHGSDTATVDLRVASEWCWSGLSFFWCDVLCFWIFCVC